MFGGGALSLASTNEWSKCGQNENPRVALLWWDCDPTLVRILLPVWDWCLFGVHQVHTKAPGVLCFLGCGRVPLDVQSKQTVATSFKMNVNYPGHPLLHKVRTTSSHTLFCCFHPKHIWTLRGVNILTWFVDQSEQTIGVKKNLECSCQSC